MSEMRDGLIAALEAVATKLLQADCRGDVADLLDAACAIAAGRGIYIGDLEPVPVVPVDDRSVDRLDRSADTN